MPLARAPFNSLRRMYMFVDAIAPSGQHLILNSRMHTYIHVMVIDIQTLSAH